MKHYQVWIEDKNENIIYTPYDGHNRSDALKVYKKLEKTHPTNNGHSVHFGYLLEEVAE